MKDYEENEEMEEQEENEEQDFGEVEVDEEEESQNDKFKKFTEIAKNDNKMKLKTVKNAHHDFEIDPNQSLEESKDDREKHIRDSNKKGVNVNNFRSVFIMLIMLIN